MDTRTQLIDSFQAALQAADPLAIVPPHLPAPTAIAQGARVIVVGAGKAAARMALAVEATWPQARIEGLVVTRYGHGAPTKRIRVVEAAHPVPDAAGERAARDILALVESAAPEDLVLALISGGGSALLGLPAPGLAPDDLRGVTRELLRSGAPIGEMNCVRKHLSSIAGGRLAQACKGRLIALAISDVAGDDLSAIASGPTVPDPTTYADALDVLAKWKVTAPAAVEAHLRAGARGEIAETPKPGDACFDRVDTQLIATASGMLAAAVAFWRAEGYEPVLLGEIEGEASEVARAQAMLVAQHAAASGGALVGGVSSAPPGEPARPVAIISGGECTVTVRGRGRGGRCSEYLLHLLMALDELGVRASALACDTDGIDGSEDNAGALVLADSAARARAAGVRAEDYAARNDAYGFFEALGDLVVTGPTRTNVNDYRVVVVERG